MSSATIHSGTTDLDSILYDLALQLRGPAGNVQIHHIPRMKFNIELVLSLTGKPPDEICVCDIGGGLSLFAPGCAAYGFRRSVLLDDFSDHWHEGAMKHALSLLRRVNVEVVRRDVLREGLSDLGEFDALTLLDTIEHWHNSPKKVLHQAVERLKPNGVLIITVPNAVNMRKRIAVPLGISNWSPMKSWYDAEVFRGHVREPVVKDLRYIARDLRLTDVQILGRNWLGLKPTNKRIINIATMIVDKPLRLFPSLCSDLYLIGRKP